MQKALNDRFNHTLFLAKDVGVIHSYSVRGHENTAAYNYSENKEIINQYEKQYSSLIENCMPLVKIYVENDIDKKAKNIEGYIKGTCDKLKVLKFYLKNGSTFVLKKR